MTIQELIDKRARVWDEAKAFVDSHAKDGVLSAEDTASYEKMEADIAEITKAIDREQRASAIEAALSKPFDTPVLGKPDAGVKAAKPTSVRGSEEYKQMILTAFRTQFRNASDLDALNTVDDAEGGYLVPEELDRRLIDTLEEENIMRRLGTTITTHGERKINIAATKPAASWIEEGQALTWGDATFAQKTLDAHKLHVAIKVTEELLYDNAFNLENYIITAFGKAIGNAEEDAFLTGNGTGKPTGLFDTTAGGEYLDPVTSLKADDVITLVYALKRPYRGKAKFLLNDKTIATLRKLKDATGTYIWQPAYQAGEVDKLLGYPVFTSAYAPENKIAFGDFSYYNIGDRGTRSFQALRELFAGNGMVGYVAKERVDGLLVLPEAVKILAVST